MEEFDRRMDHLRARFVERTRADGRALRDAWSQRDLAKVGQIAHNLAGNAGIFGYPELGEVASALERALDQQLSADELEERLKELLLRLPGHVAD